MILPLLLSLAVAQSGNKLPPANPVGYTDPDVANVMAPVQQLLAARDSAAVLAQVRAHGMVTSATENADGTRTVTSQLWPAFIEGGKWLDHRLGTPAVEIDGDIAMVWVSYTAPGRCGTDHIGLVKLGRTWKVHNLSYTVRTSGCPQ